MKILFLSCLYSETELDTYKNNSKRGFQFAAQNLQGALIDGFIANALDFKVISIPVLSTYPFGYKRPIIKSCPFVWNGTVVGDSIGYLNTPILKQINRKRLWSSFNDWNSSSADENKIVVLYGLHKKLMSIALKIKARNPRIHLCQIVPDLPRFMGCNRWYKLLGLKARDQRSIYSMVKAFDSFILLAEPMAKDLNVIDKPYMIMEGIFSSNHTEPIPAKDVNKVILYTGNINKRYGIDKLLEAFSDIEGGNYRLWIRGDGSLKADVLNYSNKDNRIVYFNQMSIEELHNLQKKATILINPVSPKEEFSKYFFPSKTMDYLASGTPMAMYKLDCLPKDYYDYMYLLDERRNLADQLVELCNRPDQEREKLGKAAAQFICTEKTPLKQVGRIVSFLLEVNK